MLTKNDAKITEFLIKNPEGKFSIREISRQIKIDYKLAYNSIKRLIEKKIINKEKYGKTELCVINLKSAIDYLIEVENIKARNFLEENIEIKLIIKEIKEKIKIFYYTLLIFGSYAKRKNHKKSDLDLLIIVPEKKFIEEVEIAVNMVSRIKPMKIHSIVVTAGDFKKMLMSKERLNVAKEVLENHLIFYGVEVYYKLLEVL